MHFVLHYLYPLLYTVVLLLYFPVFLVRLWRGDQSWRPVWQRAGLLPRSLRELPPKDAPRVWIHSVSVGEANSPPTTGGAAGSFQRPSVHFHDN